MAIKLLLLAEEACGYLMMKNWLNCILLSDEVERNAFLKHTNENGVMTRPAWSLMNELEMFKECETGSLTNSEQLADRLVNIPRSVK